MFAKIELKDNTPPKTTAVHYRTLKAKSNYPILVLTAFLLFLSCLSAFTQSIPLTLTAKDSRTGMQINPTFEAKSMKVDLEFKVVKVNNYMIVKVQSGDKIMVKAQLDGYYPDEKIYDIDDDFDAEGRTIVFELDPQPAANLSFKVVDKVNGKKLDATISLISEGELIKKVSASDASGFSNILLTLPGQYTIKTEANGYESFSYEENITVNDPPVKYDKAVGLERKKNIITLLIVDGVSKSSVQDVKLRVVNKQGDVLKNSRTTGEETEINLKTAEAISIEAEVAGYQRFYETIDIKEEKVTIQLQKEPSIKIEVLNSFSKERISANVVVTSPSGKNTTIKTSENEAFVFVPTEKGKYKYTASKREFQDVSSTLNISQLENYEYDLKIKLSSIYQDFLILVVDEDRNVIPDVDVRVFDKNDQELAINFEKSTGEWIVKLVKSEKYTYTASVRGYQVKKNDLDLSKGKLIPIELSKDLRQIKILTLDKYTKKPVKSALSYKNTSGQESEIITFEHKFSIEPTEVIKPIFSAKGYKQYEADPIGNETEATIYMVAEQYPIQLIITDVDGKKIEPDYISIISKETSAPVTIQKGNIASLDAESSYYINVKKAGYANHNSPFLPAVAITESDSKKTVKLSLKEFVVQQFKVVNAETEDLVPTLTIKALSREGTPLSVTDEENTWSVQVKNGEPFTLIISSNGYEDLTTEYDAVTGKIEQLKLTKVKTTEQIFEAYDEILKRLVPAKFTLMDDEKTTDLKLFDEGVHAKANLIEGNKYTIRISAVDYQDKQENFEYTTFTGNPKTINFKRRTYPVKFVLKTVGEQTLKSPSLKVSLNQASVNIPYLSGKKTFTADLQADETYDLVLNVEGFKTISEKVSVVELAETNLIREYTLEEIVVEKPIEIKEVVKEVLKEEVPKEPEVKVEVASVIVEKPIEKFVETPVKVADVYTKNSENLEKMPESQDEMLTVLSSKEAIGKRYILTKIYFEQSSPKMLPESDEQLNSILEVLKSNPNLKIELVGHTDNVGDSRQNVYLSKFRAKVVSSYLYNKGIEDIRISTKGMGDEFPVIQNDTEDNKSQNRRVELIVVEN
jgi:outer membrane protein OmpA-like peptidoglycan-associated protein